MKCIKFTELYQYCHDTRLMRSQQTSSLYFVIRDDCFLIIIDKVFRINLNSRMCLHIWCLRLFNFRDNVCMMFISFSISFVKSFLNVYESWKIFFNFTYSAREHSVLLHKSFKVKCNDDNIFSFSSFCSTISYDEVSKDDLNCRSKRNDS